MTVGGTPKVQSVPGPAHEAVELGIVDAACQLAAQSLGVQKAGVGQLVKILKESCVTVRELAKRLSRATKARRLRAHPDPLLLRDLERFLDSHGHGIGSVEVPEEVVCSSTSSTWSASSDVAESAGGAAAAFSEASNSIEGCIEGSGVPVLLLTRLEGIESIVMELLTRLEARVERLEGIIEKDAMSIWLADAAGGPVLQVVEIGKEQGEDLGIAVVDAVHIEDIEEVGKKQGEEKTGAQRDAVEVEYPVGAGHAGRGVVRCRG